MQEIVFAGPVGTISGYGSRSRDLCRALIKMGYNLSIIPLKWGNTPMTALKEGRDDDILSRIIFNLTDQPNIFIQCTIPEEFNPIGRYNIGITAGIETTVAPVEWIAGCNKMDLILVSSEHSLDVLKTTEYQSENNQKDVVKLTTPIEVLFEGVNLDIYLNNEAELGMFNDISSLNEIPEDFNFLFTGTWITGTALGHDRKGIATLIMNFINTFKTDDSNKQLPSLILKTNGAGFSNPEFCMIRDNINALYDLSRKQDTAKLIYPNVYVLFGDMTDEEVAAMYHHDKIKCMISYTKGEGYGRPLAEFSLTGKPIIATNWSGHIDFLKFATLLDGELRPVHYSSVNKWILKESKWFNVDIEKSSKALIEHFENYKHFLSDAAKQRQYIIDNYSFNLMAETLDTFIKPHTIQEAIEQIKLPEL